MRRSIFCLITILVLLSLNNIASAQHYTDWTGFEFMPIGEKLYELRKDYTVSLPEYFLDGDKMPAAVAHLDNFFYDWAKYSLPTCDWDFVRLEEGGILTVKNGYRWDGPSYPVRPHSSFNYRSSLVHDALYDLMRMKYMEADHNHGVLCADRHSLSDTGDCNRMMTDLMIYMIAVEDGQDIAGFQGALADFMVIRAGGACRTHKEAELKKWKYHVSELAAYASDGKVELEWKSADYSGVDPNHDIHFNPYVALQILRDGTVIETVGHSITSYTDHNVVNGNAYCYQIIPHPANMNHYDKSNEEHVIPMSGPGNALRLDGIDDYIEAHTVSNDLCFELYPTPLFPFTIEAWVYPEEQLLRRSFWPLIQSPAATTTCYRMMEQITGSAILTTITVLSAAPVNFPPAAGIMWP